MKWRILIFLYGVFAFGLLIHAVFDTIQFRRWNNEVRKNLRG